MIAKRRAARPRPPIGVLRAAFPVWRRDTAIPLVGLLGAWAIVVAHNVLRRDTDLGGVLSIAALAGIGLAVYGLLRFLLVHWPGVAAFEALLRERAPGLMLGIAGANLVSANLLGAILLWAVLSDQPASWVDRALPFSWQRLLTVGVVGVVVWNQGTLRLMLYADRWAKRAGLE